MYWFIILSQLIISSSSCYENNTVTHEGIRDFSKILNIPDISMYPSKANLLKHKFCITNFIVFIWHTIKTICRQRITQIIQKLFLLTVWKNTID